MIDVCQLDGDEREIQVHRIAVGGYCGGRAVATAWSRSLVGSEGGGQSHIDS